MGVYRTKVTDYGYKRKVAVYSRSIKYGDDLEGNTPEKHFRQSYEDMNVFKKQKSDERRIRYYQHKVIELIETAMMNDDLDRALTLTFRESITSYDYALAEWQLFLKRLRHICNQPLKYICVWEYQRARGRKEGLEIGGVFHFHALMNMGFMEHSLLERTWKQGYLWIEKITGNRSRENAIRYITKYCTKEIVYRVQHGEDRRGQRFFFTSNNLLKPVSYVIPERTNLENVIIENLERMIKDGTYDLKDETGHVMNHVEYVEYRT